MLRGYHSLPKAGTEYTPQWMKIPNFASWYHCGTRNRESDVHAGANGPRAATASTRRTVSATPGSAARAGADAPSTRATAIGSRRRTMGGPPPRILRRERASAHGDLDRPAEQRAVVRRPPRRERRVGVRAVGGDDRIGTDRDR